MGAETTGDTFQRCAELAIHIYGKSIAAGLASADCQWSRFLLTALGFSSLCLSDNESSSSMALSGVPVSGVMPKLRVLLNGELL